MNVADHERAAYRNCRRVISDQNRIGCGGRMFWGLAEPQWSRVLGLVGICSHCGHQVFTADLIGAPLSSRGGRVVGYRKRWRVA